MQHTGPVVHTYRRKWITVNQAMQFGITSKGDLIDTSDTIPLQVADGGGDSSLLRELLVVERCGRRLRRRAGIRMTAFMRLIHYK
jgi:hypothetical protein